jgi:hypothetical protein
MWLLKIAPCFSQMPPGKDILDRVPPRPWKSVHDLSKYLPIPSVRQNLRILGSAAFLKEDALKYGAIELNTFATFVKFPFNFDKISSKSMRKSNHLRQRGRQMKSQIICQTKKSRFVALLRFKRCESVLQN